VIYSLVERGGEVRSFHIDRATSAELAKITTANVSLESTLNTDEALRYRKTGKKFADHQIVNHSDDEYVRGTATTNIIEGYFSIFKKGMKGVYQHCDERHLHRYLAEFDFRYTHRAARGVDDNERTREALRGISGKRLTYSKVIAINPPRLLRKLTRLSERLCPIPGRFGGRDAVSITDIRVLGRNAGPNCRD
jgi:hypothetical protein